MAIIEFINASNKSYKGMKRAINYIMNPFKTEAELIGGKDCSPKSAFNEFVITKQNYNKETGRQFIHFTQSFSPLENTTPETINNVAKRLLEHDAFKGFQVVYSTHIDREHLHNHFIVNSVNAETGFKWQLSKEQLQDVKDYSDELCREYGLMVVDSKTDSHENRGAYCAKQKGQSWKYELFLAVKKCKWRSSNKEDFISNMEKLGYKVGWTDERKYITFTNQDGKKCRNRKLYPPEKYTKEALLKAFDLNKQQATQKQLNAKMDFLLTSINMLLQDDSSKSSGHYPLTMLEGEALADEIAEMKKGKGLDWGREGGMEI